MADIKITDDGKGKYQSFEGSIDLESSLTTEKGYFLLDFKSYGQNKEECIHNSILLIDDLIEQLKKIRV